MSQQKMHLHVICTLQRYAGLFAYHDNAAFHACALAFSLLKLTGLSANFSLETWVPTPLTDFSDPNLTGVCTGAIPLNPS